MLGSVRVKEKKWDERQNCIRERGVFLQMYESRGIEVMCVLGAKWSLQAAAWPLWACSILSHACLAIKWKHGECYYSWCFYLSNRSDCCLCRRGAEIEQVVSWEGVPGSILMKNEKKRKLHGWDREDSCAATVTWWHVLRVQEAPLVRVLSALQRAS